jgi:hypothetical protein
LHIPSTNTHTHTHTNLQTQTQTQADTGTDTDTDTETHTNDALLNEIIRGILYVRQHAVIDGSNRANHFALPTI